jgi:hypothetical protein
VAWPARKKTSGTAGEDEIEAVGAAVPINPSRRKRARSTGGASQHCRTARRRGHVGTHRGRRVHDAPRTVPAAAAA